MSLSRASTPALVSLACLSLAAYAVAERSLRPGHAEAWRTKLRAVELMESAERTILAAKRERGVSVDPRNDPALSGVVGPEFTLLTTDRGAQASKSLAAHPNFAAAVTQMMLRAGVREGDLVAVGMTGSLPGLNLAVLSACRAIGAQPLIVTSAGSSMFGATDPEMTWLDMEAVVAGRGLWPYRSLAASLGGGGDVGRGLSPAGRQILADALERSGARPLDPASVLDAVRQRVALYDSVAAARGRPIRLYVNVGGGLASLGGSQNARLIPPGLSRRLALRNSPNRGVINVLGERGIPVLHLLEVERLAREYDITDRGANPERTGEGTLFVRYRYNRWVVAAAALLVMLANLLVLRHDLRQQVLGQPHPERASR